MLKIVLCRQEQCFYRGTYKEHSYLETIPTHMYFLGSFEAIDTKMTCDRHHELVDDLSLARFLP